MDKAYVVLVVDDFQSIRKVVKDTLVRYGFEVLDADNGINALEVISQKNGKIDAIISDYNMPGMNGMDFLKEVKGTPKYKKIPFLLLTSETSKDKMKEAKEVGLDAWIQKPYTIDLFINQIKYCIEKSRKNV